MKYKIQINPEENGYVGYALNADGDTVFKTSAFKLATAASKELTRLIKQNRPELIDNNNRRHNIIDSTLLDNPPSIVNTSSNLAPRKCCGRG